MNKLSNGLAGLLIFAGALLLVACTKPPQPETAARTANTNTAASSQPEEFKMDERLKAKPEQKALVEEMKAAGQSGTGGLEINSAPPGALVILIENFGDSAGEPKQRGVTPTTLTDLPVGKYTVHLEKPGFKFAQRSAEVKANVTAKINFSLKKE